jgi:hypothetical protein
MNDSGTQVRWTPSSAYPLGKVLNRKGKHGSTKKVRGEQDGRVIKYLGVYFEAVAGWGKQQQVLKEKHSKLMADLKHAAINEWEAVYLINAKIIPTIRYPLQVAVMPRSVLKAWDDKHIALIRQKGVIAKDMPKDNMFMPEEKGGYGLTSMVDLVDRMRVESYWRCTCMHSMTTL